MWVKSSFSQSDACVELSWQKSSKSNPSGNSVEVAGDSESVLIRESDQPNQWIKTTPEKLRAFIDGVKAGEFDHFAS